MLKSATTILFAKDVIINRSIAHKGKTVIGNDSFVMAQSHISHDTEIGNFVVIGNSVKIAGSCKIGNFTVLSSCALVHEKIDISEWVLIKGGCRVNNNVPPFTIMAHNPIAYFGVNAFIMRKGNFRKSLSITLQNATDTYISRTPRHTMPWCVARQMCRSAQSVMQ